MNNIILLAAPTDAPHNVLTQTRRPEHDAPTVVGGYVCICLSSSVRKSHFEGALRNWMQISGARPPELAAHLNRVQVSSSPCLSSIYYVWCCDLLQAYEFILGLEMSACKFMLRV